MTLAEGNECRELAMAWLMRKSIRMEDSPHVHWTPETINEILTANAEVVARYSHLPPGHPDYIKEGDAPAGLPISWSGKAREAYIKELHGPLPDALTSSIVNSRIKDAVEAFEPGVHQFFPTIVTMPDGTRDDSWWAMRPCHRVDALAPEHCVDLHEYRPRPEQYPDWYYYRSNEDSRMRIAVLKEKIAGMAIWHDWKFQRDFFAEELGQLFMDEGIRGYCLPMNEINHTSHVEEV